MRRLTMTILASVLMQWGMATNCAADIYRYIDANGAYYYTNKQAPNFRLIFKTAPLTYRQDVKTMPMRLHSYDAIIDKVAQKHDMDPRLIHAVIRAESAYNPQAISTAGAVGLMQLMPDTASRYGVSDRYDPEQNVEAGTRYIKDLLRMFDSNLTLAIASYNAGEGTVIRYNRNVPPYPETQNYVRQVLSFYSKNS